MQPRLNQSPNLVSKVQNIGTPGGLALHEFGLILVIIGALAYIMLVLFTPGLASRATVQPTPPAIQSPVK